MTTRYTESKERCAEVLRATLRHLGQHEARWTPIAFTVWYEHAAGINARLSQAIDECLRVNSALDDEQVLRLYSDHVAAPDHEAVEQISVKMQRVMSGVVENVSSTGASAGAFGATMDQLAGALRRAGPLEVPGLLDSASDSASQMQATTNSLAQQISESQREVERLRGDLVRAREEALLDPLTQVLNRKGFDMQLQALMRSDAADAPASHCLVMIDIDHFKNVNDTHGHVMGDQVLAGLAKVLCGSVPNGAQRVARYGGEEFAILLPRTTLEDGARLADLMRRHASAMTFRDRRTQQIVTKVTISAGVAVIKPGDDESTWIERADAALYKSKQAGRNRVTLA